MSKMINKFIILVIAISGSLLFTACNNSTEEQKSNKSNSWGEVDYYSDFLWSKCEPDTLTKTICIDLNKEACKQIQRLTFGVYELNSNGEYVQTDTDNAQFFIDGKECDDNEFTVELKEHTEIDLGVTVDGSVEEGTLKYYLKILDTDVQLDRINDLVIDRNEVIPATFELNVIKENHANPLQAGSSSIGIIILIILAVWLLILRQILYPTFKVINISFDGQDFNNNIYFGARAKGAYKIIFSTRKYEQNIFSKIFKGRIESVSNPFFADGEMEAIPAPAKSVRFKPGKSGYVIDPSNKLNRNSMDATISSSTSKAKLTIL